MLGTIRFVSSGQTLEAIEESEAERITSEPSGRRAWHRSFGAGTAVFVVPCLLVFYGLALRASQGEEPINVGTVVAGASVATLIACGLSWVAYRLSRPGSRSAAVTLCTVLGLCTIGQVAALSRTEREGLDAFEAQTQALQREAADELERSLETGQRLDAAVTFDRLNRLEMSASSLNERDQRSIEVTIEVLRDALTPTAGYEAALDAIGENVLDPTKLQEPGGINDQLARVERLRRANATMKQAFEGLEAELRTGLKEKGFQQAEIESYWLRFTERRILSSSLELLQLETELIDVWTRMLTLLQSDFGWEFDTDGTLMIESDTTLNRFKQLASEEQRLLLKHEEIQRAQIRAMR